jgi:ectoine hydroxylase
MASGPFKENRLDEYERNGFVLAKGMFDAEEIGLLRRAAKQDRELDQHSFGRGDGEGGIVRFRCGIIRAIRFTACLPGATPL